MKTEDFKDLVGTLNISTILSMKHMGVTYRDILTDIESKYLPKDFYQLDDIQRLCSNKVAACNSTKLAVFAYTVEDELLNMLYLAIIELDFLKEPVISYFKTSVGKSWFLSKIKINTRGTDVVATLINPADNDIRLVWLSKSISEVQPYTGWQLDSMF